MEAGRGVEAGQGEGGARWRRGKVEVGQSGGRTRCLMSQAGVLHFDEADNVSWCPPGLGEVWQDRLALLGHEAVLKTPLLPHRGRV